MNQKSVTCVLPRGANSLILAAMVYDKSLVQLMSRLDSGVYFVDPDRKITFWNKAAALLTGYSDERVLGSRCSENLLRHITADGVELCLHGCPLAGTIADGKVRQTEVYMHHRDGHRLPITVWAAGLGNRRYLQIVALTRMEAVDSGG